MAAPIENDDFISNERRQKDDINAQPKCMK